jgi:hypothetical protein
MFVYQDEERNMPCASYVKNAVRLRMMENCAQIWDMPTQFTTLQIGRDQLCYHELLVKVTVEAAKNCNLIGHFFVLVNVTKWVTLL